MANTSKTVMVEFLRDFLQVSENENKPLTDVYVKVQESYGVISKYEVDLVEMICELGINPVTNNFANAPTTTNEMITRNLEYLTECTTDWPSLKVSLRAKNLLSTNEIQILDDIPDDKSRYYKMYEWISKRLKPECMDKLIECLNKSNNDHIVDHIREAQIMFIRKKTTKEKEFWTQMEQKMREYENNNSVLLNQESSRQFATEKFNLRQEITKVKAEKESLENKVEELVKKLADCARTAEAEGQNLLNEKIKLEEELVQNKSILKRKNEELTQLTNELKKVIEKLEELRKDKLELEKQIVDMNANYELEKKLNYDSNQNILANVRLDYIMEIQNLKDKITMLQIQRTEAELTKKVSLEMELSSEISKIRENIETLKEDSLNNNENQGQVEHSEIKSAGTDTDADNSDVPPNSWYTPAEAEEVMEPYETNIFENENASEMVEPVERNNNEYRHNPATTIREPWAYKENFIFHH